MKKILHPKYIGATLRNDLALLMLDTPVDPRVYVPICLSNPNTNYTSSEAMVLGWGHTQENGKGSDILQELRKNIVQDEDCYMGIYSPEQLCAGALPDCGLRRMRNHMWGIPISGQVTTGRGG